MKLATVLIPSAVGHQARIGALEENKFIDFQTAWEMTLAKEGRFNPQERAQYLCPTSMAKILRFHPSPLDLFEESINLAQQLEKNGDLISPFGAALFHTNYDLTKPLDEIPTYRDFYTHEKHVKKGFEKRGEKVPEQWYEMPVYYKGSTANFIGPEQEILWPYYTNKLDFELELAAVMLKEAKNISQKDAMNSVLGFTILNDISARDIQKKEMAVRLGPSKGKDFCSIIGPVICTLDEFANNEIKLEMKARVNGDQWSHGHSQEAHYSWEEMIEFASREEWLLPGDLLGSGTVGTGCGLELDRWISPGDVIELEIEKIGILKNRVGKKGIQNGNLQK